MLSKFKSEEKFKELANVYDDIIENTCLSWNIGNKIIMD